MTKRTANSPLRSEIDKRSRLGLTDEELKNLNHKIATFVKLTGNAQLPLADVSTDILAVTLQFVIFTFPHKSGASTLDKSWTDLDDGMKRLNLLPHDEQLQLASIWAEARDGGDWAKFVNHSIFQAESRINKSGMSLTRYPLPLEEQEAAIEKSWEHPFKGKAATGLKIHIETHYNPNNLGIYAHFSTIVQSSGMGKSRSVDELAKECFVIPLNLRVAASTGYPPADHSVRDYLTSPGFKGAAYQRVCAFLEALFTHTTKTLLDFDGQPDYIGFARKFRLYMTEGQTIKGHNQFREHFYKCVVEMAKHQLAGPIPTPAQNEGFPPYTALKKLGQVLGSSPDFSAPSIMIKKQQKAHQNNVHLVVLAFDEAHAVTVTRQQAAGEWSVFNELCEALRRLHGLPLFSLFLSTSAKFSQPTSAVEDDLSKRVYQAKLVAIQPYTDLGFDPLAHIISADGKWNLEQLTEDAQMFSLGRPLFAARYLEGSANVKEEIIQFAATKLLHTDHTVVELSNHQELACLSQRLPIEFNPTNYTSQKHEKKQVEAHMRICLKIDAHFETITTTSSSEPILSEAAYFIMQKDSFNAPRALKSVMEGFSVSKGDRGEFLVLLLLTLARDSAVGPADEYGRPTSGRRWFGLADFLYGNLFRKNSSHLDKTSRKALRQLAKDFPNSHLHFSHFMKVHEFSAIDLESLLLLQGRGAAVLCANHQKGLDAINIFLKDGTRLVRENAGLTFIQIKNDFKYSSTPDQKLFDAMDPYSLKVLREGEIAVPLIKIVFALAAKTPALHVVRHDPTTDYGAVIYEIWCAGISPNFLEPIKAPEVEIWDSLLQASYGWKEIYKTTLEVTENLRKSATPGAARDAGHYSCWASRGAG